MSQQIDIVIPVYNGMPFIREAVESCLTQSAAGLTITVIDNASTDGTWEWLTTVAQRDNRINLLRNSTNIGMGPNIRRCLQNIKAERFSFLCADDKLFSKNSLAIASAIMDANPSVGVVYSDMAYVDARGRVIWRRRSARSGPFSSREVGWKSILEGRNLFGIPILTKTALLAEVQFEESLTYAGDVDFAIRIGMLCTSWHHPDFLIANRYHDRNATKNLHRLAREQFLAIAKRNGYHLTTLDFFRMSASCTKTWILKILFLYYAAFRAAAYSALAKAAS
jgi:glycosyltransferase involved in cell wall biosynthesis